MATRKEPLSIMANFRCYFAKKRRELNLTQAELAKRMCVASSSVQKYESGAIGSVNDDALVMVAKGFGVEIEEVHYALLGLEDLWRLRDKDIRRFMQAAASPLGGPITFSAFLDLIRKCQELETVGLQTTSALIEEVLSQSQMKK